ncbi:hypothetical protein CRG98_048235, partial [Punica granatum]
REAVVEGSYSKKLREASYWAISGAMTMAFIIVGLGATVANWKPMATASFSGFIGAVLGSAVGEFLTRWFDKKTTEALLKLARAGQEATEETMESGQVPPVPVPVAVDIPRPWLVAALKGVCFTAGLVPPLLPALLARTTP